MTNQDVFPIESRITQSGDVSYFWGTGTDADEAYDEFKRYLANDSQDGEHPLTQLDPADINDISNGSLLPFPEAFVALANNISDGKFLSIQVIDKKYFDKNVTQLSLDDDSLTVLVKGEILPSTKLYNIIKSNQEIFTSSDEKITNIAIKNYKTKYKINYQKSISKKVRYFIFSANGIDLFATTKLAELKKFAKQYLTNNYIKNYTVREEMRTLENSPIHAFEKLVAKQNVKIKLTTGKIRIDKKIKSNVYLFKCSFN